MGKLTGQRINREAQEGTKSNWFIQTNRLFKLFFFVFL
jgi:hypothetical protein